MAFPAYYAHPHAATRGCLSQIFVDFVIFVFQSSSPRPAPQGGTNRG